MPIAKGDTAVISTGSDTYRTAFLLAAVYVIRECIIGAYVIELRRRLVVPGGKTLSPIHRHDSALVAGDQ
jgi:hypothetical protein